MIDFSLLNALTVFVAGLCIGSFLNVCIYRIPEGMSVVSPSSSCPACGHNIRWFENIPVLSYLFLKGRCGSCGAGISMQYPLVELLTALLLTLLFLKTGIGILFVIYALFTSSLIVITFIDLRLQIIPDIISLPGIVAGFLFSFLPGGIGWLDSFIGILAGGGVLYLVAWGYFTLTKRDGMGGGDIKLLGMIGAFLGWQSIPFVIFVSAAAGTLVGIPFMLIHGKDMKFAIPFGPFLSGAAVCYIFFGKEVTEWYISISTIH